MAPRRPLPIGSASTQVRAGCRYQSLSEEGRIGRRGLADVRIASGDERHGHSQESLCDSAPSALGLRNS